MYTFKLHLLVIPHDSPKQTLSHSREEHQAPHTKTIKSSQTPNPNPTFRPGFEEHSTEPLAYPCIIMRDRGLAPPSDGKLVKIDHNQAESSLKSCKMFGNNEFYIGLPFKFDLPLHLCTDEQSTTLRRQHAWNLFRPQTCCPIKDDSSNRPKEETIRILLNLKYIWNVKIWNHVYWFVIWIEFFAYH